MKSCFEDRTLQLLEPADNVDDLYKSGKMSAEEYAQYIEHDTLQSELSNIKQEYTESGNLQYNRIIKTKKRDRATSLFYGLSVISEWELENKQNLYKSKNTGLELLEQYTYL